MSIDLSKIAFYKDIDKLEGDLKNRLEQLGLKRTYANTVAPNYDGSYDIDSIGSLTYTGDDSHCKIIRIKDKDGKHPAVNFDTIENKFINSIANTTASKQSIKLMSSTDPHTGIKTYIGVCSIQIPAGSSNIKLKTIDYSPINVQYSFNVNTTANQVYISFSSPKANTTVEIQKIVISYEIKPECV